MNSDLTLSVGGNISMPQGAWVEIEQLARKWQTSKSGAIRRIIQEWKEDRQPQTNKSVEKADLALAA